MTKLGPIECRVRHQPAEGRWVATARRGSGVEGRTATDSALGPAAAAWAAIAALEALEAMDAKLDKPAALHHHRHVHHNHDPGEAAP